MKINAIHARGEVPRTTLGGVALVGLGRIQQHVRIRPIELRRGRHAQGHLWNTRRTLAEEPIRGKPGRRISALDILPQSDIDGIVILRDIPIDVVQSAVAHLNVNLAAEHKEEIPDHWNLTGGLPGDFESNTMLVLLSETVF